MHEQKPVWKEDASHTDMWEEDQRQRNSKHKRLSLRMAWK